MPFGNTFVQVYTGNALCKYVFRHKTCYSEEQLQQELSKTGAFTEKNLLLRRAASAGIIKNRGFH